jgi:hypothetical protein
MVLCSTTRCIPAGLHLGPGAIGARLRDAGAGRRHGALRRRLRGHTPRGQRTRREQGGGAGERRGGHLECRLLLPGAQYARRSEVPIFAIGLGGGIRSARCSRHRRHAPAAAGRTRQPGGIGRGGSRVAEAAGAFRAAGRGRGRGPNHKEFDPRPLLELADETRRTCRDPERSRTLCPRQTNPRVPSRGPWSPSP